MDETKILKKVLRIMFVTVILATLACSALAEGTADDPVNFDRAALIQAAIDNQVNSYAPYSGFNVSAAVLMDSGKVYLGVNVENASFPVGVCAEHNAIDFAVGCGERRIIAIAIVGGSDYSISDYCAPCGVCRQAMREFSIPAEMRVIMAKST